MQKRRPKKRDLPKYPIPEELGGIVRNPTNGLYEITESGITYSIPFELVSDLKMFFIQHRGTKVSEWYKNLQKFDKELCLVIKIIQTLSIPRNEHQPSI